MASVISLEELGLMMRSLVLGAEIATFQRSPLFSFPPVSGRSAKASFDTMMTP